MRSQTMNGGPAQSLNGAPAVGARARSRIDRCAAVEKVIAAMLERIDRPFALDEMARIAYLSPFYFNRVFRQLTGVPPRRFHTALRIAAAKRLLLTTDLSVTEVCFELGYQSLGTFTTHFHDLVGVSPRTLRRLAAEPGPAQSRIAEALLSGPENGTPAAVTGTVLGGGGDRLVFVGLFNHAFPQGMPVACTAIAGSGDYALHTAAQGRFHVAAAAVAPHDLRGGLLPEDGAVMVGLAASPVQLGTGQRQTRDLRLRPKRRTDPPILFAIPLTAGRHGGPRSRTPHPLASAAPA